MAVRLRRQAVTSYGFPSTKLEPALHTGHQDLYKEDLDQESAARDQVGARKLAPWG
jgi:hypothetical protein